MAFKGRRFVLHGSFASKADAVRKEHEEKGRFILNTKDKGGHRRFTVLSVKGGKRK